jgi:hypothetical protein
VIQANLAFLLATCPDPRVHNPQEALDLALALNSPDAPPNPVYLNLLAIAQAQTGKLENAMRTIQQAEDAARLANDEEMFQSILRTRQRIEQMMMQPAPTPASAPTGRP